MVPASWSGMAVENQIRAADKAGAICVLRGALKILAHLPSKKNKQDRAIFWNEKMGFFYSKGFGGRRAGGTITADRHGVRRPVFRFRCCGLNCFR
jgi:hypothetical protein